jgi:exopolysaccharide biosynthesis polyprenyl glycosylphosphotransferase
MKKSELIFNLITIPADAFMLFLAGIVSFYLRQKSINIVGPILYQLRAEDLLLIAYKLIPALLLIFAWLGLYNLRGTRKFASEFSKVILGVSVGLFLVVLVFFFDQTIFPSRFIILATWGLGIIFVIFGRLIIKFFQQWLFSISYGLHKLVIVNGQNSNSEIIEKFYKNKSYGYEIVKEVDFNKNTLVVLEKLFTERKIDEVLQSNTTLSDEDNLKLVEFCRNKGLQFSFVPDLFQVQRNSVETNDINGIPVICLKNTPLDGWGKVAKRIMDIILSIICLILTSPLFLIIAIAIKLDSKGKAIYSALRGGRNKDFDFYKFRSMFSHLSIGEEYGGTHAEIIRHELWNKNARGNDKAPFLKVQNDPRVTKVGKFLRKTKLDEIPQFWNVLRGDMSMVGPRAHVLDEVERYRSRYRRMFSIKPGIFGISQIAQATWQNLPFEEEIRLNTFYIENWSLWLDIKILAKSFWILFFRHKDKENYY